MLTDSVQTRITLDDLASELLPSSLITAITNVTIERWRRQTMNHQHAPLRPQTKPGSPQRVLPVVVLGETVIQPVRFPDPLVMRIEEGKSYRAMLEAMRSDSEVLLVFVSEPELAGFRSSVAQRLPTVGVIARVQEVTKPSGATHRIQIDALSRADVVARIDHAPFYQAACIPRPDPTIGATAVASLMRHVKQHITELAQRISPTDAPYGMDFVNRMVAFVNSIQEPGRLADAVAAGPMFSFGERLALLQMFDPVERLRTVEQKLGSEPN